MSLTIEDYLEQISRCVNDPFGRRLRQRFADNRGFAELAMLAAPNNEELESLKKAVAVMTPAEKTRAAELSDEQVRKIADDARIDPAILAIFINGYALETRKPSEG